MIASFRLGNPTTRTPPKSITEIAKLLDFKNRHTVYGFQQLALKLNLISRDEYGDIIKPKLDGSQKFTEYVSNEKFCNNYLVNSWVNDLKHRKSGEPLSSATSLISRLKTVCNTLKVNPAKFLQGNTNKQVLDSSTTLMQNFVDLYMEERATIRKTKNATIPRVSHHYAKTVRDFMAYHGYSYPRGTKGVMTQSITLFHGNYADVKLSDSQIEQAEKYITDNWGLDSDIYRC